MPYMLGIYKLDKEGNIMKMIPGSYENFLIDKYGRVYTDILALGGDFVIEGGDAIASFKSIDGNEVMSAEVKGYGDWYVNMGFSRAWIVRGDGKVKVIWIGYNFDNTYWGVRHHDRANTGCGCDP